MSYIKRKRDRRDYELRRMFDQFARMPQRIVTSMPELPEDYDPNWNRIWAISDQPTLTFNTPRWNGR